MAKKADKFARFKAARAAKSSLAVFDNDDEDYNLYDEVDEDEYRKHKRDELLKDDFVVQDNGEGYVDNGVDEWDSRTHNYYSEEESNGGDDGSEGGEGNGDGKGAKKRKRKVKKNPTIAEFLNKNHQNNSSGNNSNLISGKKKLDITSFDDILNDFDVKKSTTSTSNSSFNFLKSGLQKKDIFSSAKKQTFSTPNNSSLKRENAFSLFKNDDFSSHKKLKISSDNNVDDSFTIEQPSSPIVFKKDTMDGDIGMADISKIKNLTSGKDPLSPLIKETEEIELEKLDDDNDNEEEEDDDDDDDIIVSRRPRAATSRVDRSVNLAATKKLPTVKSTHLNSSPIGSLTNLSSNGLTSSPTRTSTVTKLSSDDIIELDEDEENPSFKMYWLDYAEVGNSLLLFGKMKTKNNELVSGVVQINNIARNLYFLPRKFRQTDDGLTDEKVTALDVHEEIVPLLLEKYGLDSLRAKPEVKKYAFELPNIPREETEYLKVLLPYDTPKNSRLTLPSELEGETFSHLFGSNNSIFETFVLERNIMGPCWLEFKNGDFKSLQNISHCRVEVSINSPNECVVMKDQLPSPPLNVVSISVQTTMNSKSNKQEIAAVSLAVYKDLPQDLPIDENLQPNDTVTLVRNIAFPPGILPLAKQQNFNLRTFKDEKTLLNCLCALIKVNDPDTFVGHRLENISLDALVHRMYDLQISTWSNFGRRNRKSWPDRFGSSSNNKNGLNNLQVREIFQGRLLCDIANEMGQSLTTKCQSWDLSEMYQVVCKKTSIDFEINLSNPKILEDANTLMINLKEILKNALISAEIAFRIQILSLSKQLTNLAGNAWSHTLGGTRAGRNEYILLHEFTRNGYIVPDKENRYNRNAEIRAAKTMNDEDRNDDAIATSSKKSKYQGGLVFEPEKGLHKNYVLVMDFNSLYPSIIQEFNICFTTVNRSLSNQDEIPSVPDLGIEQGVLPRLLATLVNRRREVKKLLKDSKSTQAEKIQYDIKQQALKLTANSMYGCLGYVNSRFYAKPLAMLVTNKGREILMDTRQLAESLGLRVIYGDTDSVMIDTGSIDYKEALAIGSEFKAKVNERYRLLEIDVDNVFKKILLHAKKKYAAMNVVSFENNTEVLNLEVKGLDMRRREYCQLSKEVSTYVLNKLLSSKSSNGEDDDSEQTLNEIYDYLTEITSKIKNNEIRIDKYAINTRLSKDPKQYAQGKTMPSVQVALRLRKQGKVIKAGAVITFVITEGDESISAAERARSLQEIMANKSTNEYKPDAQYYLEKQIYAPVERLVERIDSVDLVRIATSLGLDSKKYEHRARSSTASNELQPLESMISDAERFKNSEYLTLQCSCGSSFKFGGIQASKDYMITHHGVQCNRCSTNFSNLRVTSQLEKIIRANISLYYSGWLYCDDVTCGIVTRQISVYGRRCIGHSGKAHGCKGIMRYRYSDKQLYNQLLFFDSIFDVDKAKKRSLKPLYEEQGEEDKENVKPITQGALDALCEQNRDFFDICRGVINRYLNNSGRRYVDMGSIFEFMVPEQKAVN
ncbi:hypothetical protein PACTADRAFT_14300 [Pachysolen tannophilus NRRL Y-2460]|uniref:DNA polymerase n=1 Tax=Pachysolen tannophilus NRRL Y-2460 TaxID=669874 RepID=A0A1E4U1L7_PACTA|nr:hypothetical protein PACTADRAFT_14300 [Pachysolen tannophilus NRRL Y-2460]